ncbi:hypothetical protein SAY87_022195 [Trapa incisa]|uniref:Uncharacterized protein n=1 Tax=Trapa incisa TaxID=236973 RepID=A0AAN7JUC4_9MYRT|nr:hypothetical protein SAY87_022195 [Trapa incisa]
MASACVNNIGMSPDGFLATSCPPYTWLSPRVSFSPSDGDCSKSGSALKRPLFPPQKEEDKGVSKPPPVEKAEARGEDADPESSGGDFEFCLEDPVAMLPADELFSDGMIVPLQVSMLESAARATNSPGMSSQDLMARRRRSDVSSMDIYITSPKAPRCSSRWKEILGLKKLCQNANAKATESTPSRRTSIPSSSSTCNPKSFKHFLHRGSKASNTSDSSLNMPLLKDLDSDSVIVSSRRSLSYPSSGGGHEHEDIPRLSLDSNRPYSKCCLPKNPNVSNVPRMRLVKPRADIPRLAADNPTQNKAERSSVRRQPVDSGVFTPRGISADSPRMNSSGKVIFQGLERSSSSPSSFNGGPRFKHRGMERCYSAGVRVTPVLNVPMSSLIGSSKSGSVFGFGPLFTSSPQKKDATWNGNGGNSSRSHFHHQQSSIGRNNRMDRT